MKRAPLKRKTPLRAKSPIKRGEIRRRALVMNPEPVLKKRTIRRPRKRRATEAEKAFMSRVAKLGCVVSRNLGLGWHKPCLHHIRTGYGGGEKASNWEVLPLTRDRHQDGGMGVAFHAGPRTWQAKFGTEVALLKQVYDELGIDFEELPRLRGSEPPWWAAYKRGVALIHPAHEIFKEDVHDEENDQEAQG